MLLKLTLVPLIYLFSYTTLFSQEFNGDTLLHLDVYYIEDLNSWKKLDINDNSFLYNGKIIFEEDKITVNINSIINNEKTDFILKFRNNSSNSKNKQIISNNFSLVPIFLLEDDNKNHFTILYYSWNSLGADVGFFVFQDFKNRYTYIIMPDVDVYSQILKLYK